MFSQKRHQESFFLWENPARADFLWCCWQLLLRISLIFPLICLQLLRLKKLYEDLRWSSFWDAASSASSVETETGQKNGSHKSGPSRQPAEPLYTFHYNSHYKLSLQFSLQTFHYNSLSTHCTEFCTASTLHIAHCTTEMCLIFCCTDGIKSLNVGKVRDACLASMSFTLHRWW